MEVSYLDLNDNEINLSPETVKKYIAPNANITNQEMAMFLKLCQHQRLMVLHLHQWLQVKKHS